MLPQMLEPLEVPVAEGREMKMWEPQQMLAVQEVLDGIDAAYAKGLAVKLNCVPVRELNPEEPVLTTSETIPGLTYTLVEGASLNDMRPGASKIGDGTKWTPPVTVKGGSSGFYTIKVTK